MRQLVKLTKRSKNVSIAAVSLLLAAALFVGYSVSSPAVATSGNTVIVTPGDMATNIADVIADPASWYFFNDETTAIDNSLGAFLSGPSAPPAGESSVEIAVSGSQRRNLATSQFGGTALSDITEMKYSTYNPSTGNGGSINRAGYLQFNVDFDGTNTWQSRLVFLPSDNGTVQQDTWQEWDAINSGNAVFRYSGSVWPGTSDPGLSTTKTLDQIMTEYPGVATSSQFLSWLGIRVGEPYANGYTENIDKFVFGTVSETTTFDFERYYPTSGEITAPTSGEYINGTTDLLAAYDDGDVVNDDIVQWAVRFETCAAGTNTVFGNVDGFNDPYTWGGAAFSSSFDTTAVADGEYCLIFNPRDDTGQNDVRETVTFNIDNTGPTVVVTDPYVDSYQNNPVTIAGTAIDAGSGVDSVALHIRDATTNTLIVGCTSLPGTLGLGDTWALTINDGGSCNLVDGYYEIAAWSYDNVGNPGWATRVSFYIDTVVPTMSNLKMFVSTDGGSTYPQENDLVKSGDFVRIEVDAEDAESGLQDVEFRIIKDGGGGYFTARVWVDTPVSGNTYQFDFQVPTDGEYYDTHAPISELPDGNAAWVRATDNAGNYFHGLTELFTFDNTAPDAMNVSPADDAFVNGTSILQEWDSTASDVDYFVYESYNDAAGTSLRWTDTFSGTSKTAVNVGEAEYWWRVKAVDMAGNESAWTPLWKITVDNTNPAQVLGMTIFKGGDTSGDNLGCSGFVNDRLITVFWEDSTDTNFDYYRYMTKSGWNTTLVPSQRTGMISDVDGEYRYQVQAVDKAGNVGEYSEWCYVTLDRVAPVSSALTSPTDSSFWGAPISITGETADLNGVDFVNIYYRTAGTTDPYVLATSVSPLDNPANDSPFAWTVDWTPPAEGVYDIQASGVDLAGNEESSVFALNVTYDVTAPAVDAGPDQGTVSAEFTQTGTATDTNGLASTVWATISGPGVVTFGTANALVTTVSTSVDGSYTVKLTATDTSGNVSEDTFSFTWTTPTPPTVLGVTTTTVTTSTTPGAQGAVAFQAQAANSEESASDEDVLGENTDTDSAQSAVASENTGSSNENDQENKDDCFEILGICWYWWIAIIAAIGLGYYLYRILKEDEESPAPKS